MARTAIPAYVTNQVITAAHGNTYWRMNEAAHWPYSANGDIPYRSAVDTLAVLAIGAGGGLMTENGSVPSWLTLGTAGQGLRTNNAGTAPEYANVMLDWEELTIPDWSTTARVSTFETVPSSTITLTLPVPGIVYAIVVLNLTAEVAGETCGVRVGIDSDYGDVIQTKHGTEYYITSTATHIKACAAGNIDCLVRLHGTLARTKAKIQNGQITAWAIAGT